MMKDQNAKSNQLGPNAVTMGQNVTNENILQALNLNSVETLWPELVRAQIECHDCQHNHHIKMPRYDDHFEDLLICMTYYPSLQSQQL